MLYVRRIAAISSDDYTTAAGTFDEKMPDLKYDERTKPVEKRCSQENLAT